MKGVPIQVTDQNGKAKIIRKPTFIENLRFMLSYQIDYMYFRYFMWNFSGRQNDTQGYGGAVNGNWITGIDFLDQKRVGTSDMPADMKNDPSRNTYYLLPFILGLIGMFYHFNRDNKELVDSDVAVSDDRSGDHFLSEPVPDAAQGKGLCLCRLILFLRYLDRNWSTCPV